MAESTRSPRITVLMPIYNGARFLHEAVTSILEQSYKDFELLIIDDASKDDSLKVIKAFTDPRIRLVQNKKNLGLIGTLNRGLELAKGEFIARMDQDDIAVSERLAKQLSFLSQRPELLGVGTALQLISENGAEVGKLPALVNSETVRRAVAVVNPFAHPTMMIRKKAALEVGGYSEEAYAAEDYDLWARLCQVGDMSNLDEPLLRYRLNPQGMSISLRKKQKNRFQLIADREWERFGEEGPAPRSIWEAMWPNERAHFDPEHLLLYSTLHLNFAKGYRRRGKWGIALRHWLSALKWYKLNRGCYVAIGMFVLPYAAYSRLEERLAILLNNSRANKKM